MVPLFIGRSATIDFQPGTSNAIVGECILTSASIRKRDAFMARVLLDNVVKRYGPILAMDMLALEVRDGEFLTLPGRSGAARPRRCG